MDSGSVSCTMLFDMIPAASERDSGSVSCTMLFDMIPAASDRGRVAL